LLPEAVTLHKSDLAIDLPRSYQFTHKIEPSPEQASRYRKLLDALVKQIRQDMKDEERAGKLFGQLAELPSYLDRATRDVGNCGSGAYEIRYPDSLGLLDEEAVVATQEGLDDREILPKEQWMLDRVAEEVAEGRNVMVLTWHLGLLPRLLKLCGQIEAVGAEGVVVLNAEKVPPQKRQDWIDREVVKRKRKVLVANPVAIQTGLNNLVWFSTQVWMENPACNAIVYRQSMGRVDRIGQTRQTRVHFPLYAGTMQEQLHALLLKKVAVSVSTDGLDPESALAAAGVAEDDVLTGLSIGKQLWAMIGGMNTSETPPSRAPSRRPARGSQGRGAGAGGRR
jgi:SNF2 family DNA or RNA helicase